jgi:hypothetical protein
MTKLLEDALRQPPDAQIKKIADFAEFLVSQQQAAPSPSERFLKLQWVGSGADAYPEHASGVEAAHAAGRMIAESRERSLPK